ncbi:hypothetical protein G7Y79_00067g095440 [Physcia stellaris]|nr:hypothetical protein G7Y79_00067g095440 [Physcia stellaris]
MAWVRPKHQKPKVVDHTDARKSMLQYFSGQRSRPNTHKIDQPQKQNTYKIDRPQKLDPTLQAFAQNKQAMIPEAPKQANPPKIPQAKRRPRQCEEPAAIIVDYESDYEDFEEVHRIVAPPPPIINREHQPRYLPQTTPAPRAVPRPTPRAVPRRDWVEAHSSDRFALERRSVVSSHWASAVQPLFR